MNNNKFIIVGSSPEATKFVPIDGYQVIAVNQAIHITKHHTDYWFTLDPSIENQKIMDEQPYDCIYTAAVPVDFGSKRSKMPCFRRNRPDNVKYFNRMTGPGPLSSHYGLCEKKTEIATGNSAYGALNLALHLKAREIILLGVSALTRTKFDGSVTKDLSHLPMLFESATTQLKKHRIKVYNANKETALTCFPHTDIFEEVNYIEHITK